MRSPLAKTAFQATDLQRSHRAVLDEARESGALIRDKDGLLLLLRPAEEVDRQESFLEIMWSTVFIERVLQRSPNDREPIMYGPYAWLSILPEEDQKKFLEEVIDQLLVSKNSGSNAKLEQLIEDWQVSARTWSHEDLRTELTKDLDQPLHDVTL
ncbi:MAG: hypothetical protein WDN07_01600 [Actinomycetota bacterium]